MASASSLKNIGNRHESSSIDVKNYILNLSLEEKRKLYACGQDYFTIKDIPIWENFEENCENNDSSVDLERNVYSNNAKLNSKIGLHYGNIAALEVDAIVNAANKSLLGGGGVDGVIHRAAGKSLRSECKLLRGCETGEAKLTGGYNLPAKYVIHTVGPIGENSQLLENCYFNSLTLAMNNKLRSVAFPCVSTGIYGYPNDKAADVVLKTTRNFLEKHADDFDVIIFCLFLDKDKDIYLKLLPHYFPK